MKVIDLYADTEFGVPVMDEVVAEAAYNVAEILLKKTVSLLPGQFLLELIPNPISACSQLLFLCVFGGQSTPCL